MENDEVRRRMLAKIHIAKKELLRDEEEIYRFWIKETSKGRCDSAKDLSIEELKSLLRKFKRYGWKDSYNQQAQALKYEIVKVAKEKFGTDFSRRLNGLIKSKFGVDNLRWVRNVADLRRLLTILRKIKG